MEGAIYKPCRSENCLFTGYKLLPKAMFLLFGILLLAENLDFAYAYPAADKTTAKMICQKNVNEDIASIRKIPVESEIIEFSINPAGMILGTSPLPEKITFKWQVKPEKTPKTKTKLTLAKSQGSGPALNFATLDLEGKYSINMPKDTPEGKTAYTLTVGNEQYDTNVATVIFEVKSLQFALEDIDVNGLNLGDISGSAPEGAAFDLFVSINNRSSLDIPAMKLKVLICKIGGPCTDNPLSYGEIPFTIFKGHRTYRIPAKFMPSEDPGWTSIKIKLLHSQTNILLRIWEFPIISEQKKVYSLM